MKLHNRLVKGEFLSDVDLLFLDAQGLVIYEGLILLAEDSGCLECHPLQIKALAFPMRQEITPDLIAETIAALAQHGKAIIYENGNGKQYINLPNFLKHQALRSPAPPTIPLPPWVRYHKPEGEKYKCGRYELVEAEKPTLDGVEIRRDLYESLRLRTLSIPFVSDSIPEGESEREIAPAKPERPIQTGKQRAEAERRRPGWQNLATKIKANFPNESQYTVPMIVRQLEQQWGEKGPTVVDGWVSALIKAGRVDDVTVFSLWAEYSKLEQAPDWEKECRETQEYLDKMGARPLEANKSA